MKPLVRLGIMALIVIFTCSSVAWAGVVESKNLPQGQSQIGLQNDQISQYSAQRPIIKNNPPAFHNHPGTHNPPAFHNHPALHNPSAIHNTHHFNQHYFNNQRYHHWNRDWPHNRSWNHDFNDWDWFTGFGLVSLGAYYADTNYDRVMYVQFQPENVNYFQEVTTRYGDYNYRDRISGFGGEGWRHYWFSEKNIICVFLRDDGYTHTFMWNRSETDHQAVALGLLTAEQLAVYSPYNANMPANLAEEYVNYVLWSQTEWK